MDSILNFFEEFAWILSELKNDTSTFTTTINFLLDPVVLFMMIFALGIFLLIRWRYLKYKRIAETPDANEALVGYYVKFAGIVAQYNKFEMPIKEKKCEFYRLKIIGKWSTRAKSPSKGIVDVTKQLYYESNNRFLLKNDTLQIYVEFENSKDIESSSYQIKAYQGEAKELAKKYNVLYNKAEKYEYILNYILEKEEITVYGKLTKQGGDLVITDTYSTNYPFMLKRGNQIKK